MSATECHVCLESYPDPMTHDCRVVIQGLWSEMELARSERDALLDRLALLEAVATAARELAPCFHSDTSPGIQEQFNREDALRTSLAKLDAAEGVKDGG